MGAIQGYVYGNHGANSLVHIKNDRTGALGSTFASGLGFYQFWGTTSLTTYELWATRDGLTSNRVGCKTDAYGNGSPATMFV